MEDVSLVVIQYGELNFLYSMLDSLDGHKDSNLISEIIIVNNGEQFSEQQIHNCQQYCSGVKKKFIKNDKNTYSSAVNRGVKESEEDIIALSNNDIEWISGESISTAIREVQNNDVDIISPKLVYPNGDNQKNWHEFHNIWKVSKEIIIPKHFKSDKYEFRSGGIQSIDGYLIGAFLIMEKSTFNDIGGFDERFNFYGEDVDFCYRASQNNYQLYIDFSSKLVHIGGGASNNISKNLTSQLYKARTQYLEKHHGRMYTNLYLILKFFATLERLIAYSIISSVTDAELWDKRQKICLAELLVIMDIFVNE
ncbi:glycosyltransferase [Natronomonas gomsonensis]|uniref:glycosyltransferase family 2 protein n=1 Tax=Natronomonas gomsonensis TaxID=1046043 RepID=UPI0020CA326C|nr:glycosyltransferase [Natronomonas gomsonensis]MCY4732431.1 glycosyltransferase [Natronomonas gomsonensis]